MSARLSVEEVNFSRLLRTTEKALARYQEGEWGREDEGKEEERRYVFQSGRGRVSLPIQVMFERPLATLSSLWHHLAASESAGDLGNLKRLHGGPPPSKMSLAAYKNKLDSLIQSYDSVLVSEQATFERDHPDTITNVPKEPGTSMRPLAHPVEDLHGSRKISVVSEVLLAEEELFEGQNGGLDPFGMGLSVEELIKKHRELQEQLTEEILMMVSALKETSIQSLEIVREDNSRLETVEQEVAENIEMVRLSLCRQSRDR
jgi:hypothetical protein